MHACVWHAPQVLKLCKGHKVCGACREVCVLKGDAPCRDVCMRVYGMPRKRSSFAKGTKCVVHVKTAWRRVYGTCCDTCVQGRATYRMEGVKRGHAEKRRSLTNTIEEMYELKVLMQAAVVLAYVTILHQSSHDSL